MRYDSRYDSGTASASLGGLAAPGEQLASTDFSIAGPPLTSDRSKGNRTLADHEGEGQQTP